MFTTIDEFLGSWEYESSATKKMFAELTDASLGVVSTPGERPLARVAWHIIQSIPEMMGHTGLTISSEPLDAPPPATAEALQKAYDEACASLVGEIKAKWTDEDMHKEDNMYGENWKRGVTLGVLMLHQTHHRGQLSTYMRIAGLRVPGPYGPAREEWEKYGMPPQE